MFNFRHFQPDTFPEVNARPDTKVLAFIPEILEKAYADWLPIPGTDLEVNLFKCMDSTHIRFRREGDIISVHVFCLVGFNSEALFDDVLQILEYYGHTEQERPQEPNWIYSIPTTTWPPYNATENKLVHGIVFTVYTLLLCHRLREIKGN
jgi:hypothetical protein